MNLKGDAILIAGNRRRIVSSFLGSVKKFVSLEENDSFLVRITI